MNATNGGSSGNQLPISAEMLEHRDAMAPLLRIDYSCVSQVLQALSNIAHVVSFVPSKSLTVEALDEFSLFPIPDGLVSHVAEYVFCVWSSVHGRKSARDKIVEFFNCESRNSHFCSPMAESCVSSADARIAAPQVPIQSTHTDVKADSHVSEYPPRATSFDNQLKEASKRASQLLKAGQATYFDGVTNPNLYAVYKFDITELVMSSGTSPDSFVSFEITMLTLRGPALQSARQFICRTDVYHQEDSVAKLWKFLDSQYMTTEAIRYVSEVYNNCRQNQHETVAGYCSRFQRIAHLIKAQQPHIDDINLIVKLSGGLTSNNALMARGIVDAMCISSFASYCIQIINVSKSMERITRMGDPGDVRNNVAGGNVLCLKCGDRDHLKDDCKKEVKYPCKYCNSNDHYSRICPTCPKGVRNPDRKNRDYKFRQGQRRPSKKEGEVSAAAMAASMLGRLENVDTDSDGSSVSNSVFSISSNSAGIGLDPRLVDFHDPMMDLVIKSKLAPVMQASLLDTGAGANFINVDFAEFLIKRKAVRKDELIQLSSPITITYGNSSSEKVDCALPLRVKSSSDANLWTELLFVVTPNSSYPIILGRTGLKQLGLLSKDPQCMLLLSNSYSGCVKNSSCAVGVSHSDVAIQATHSNCKIDTSVAHFSISSTHMDSPNPVNQSSAERKPLASISSDNRVQVSHSLLESAVVLPYRAPRRPRSSIDLTIIRMKLEQMEKDGKVEKTESIHCHMVHELVLVDKLSDKRLPRTIPESVADLKRYRITLDIRCGNDLKLVQIAVSQFALLPNELAGQEKRFKNDSSQCQASSLEILSHLQADCDYFGKIDLDDAYSSVLIPGNLRALFCFCLPGHESTYYRWRCLVQGWRYSPLLFSTAIEFMLDICRPHMPSGIHLRHFQDDILVAGKGRNSVEISMTKVMETFRSYGFVVNESKTKLSDSAVFCGYQISSKGIIPYPKSPVTSAFFDSTWSAFENAKSNEIRLNLLRQWSGRFNYFLGFLPPDQLTNLREIYSKISVLMKEPQMLSGEHVLSLRASLSSLCSFVADGNIPVLNCGVSRNTLYSVICTDANVDSYAGILFRLCLVDQSSTEDHVSSDFIKALKESQVPLDYDHRRLILIPVRITGGRFSVSEQKQSSTYRERVSQLLCVDEFHSMLQGEVIVVCDNQNVSKRWHNIDETLSYGGNLVRWMRFTACVHHIVWVPREIVDFVDYLARCIAPPKPAVKNLQHSVDVSSAPEPAVPPQVDGIVQIPELVLPLRKAIQDCYLEDTTMYLNVRMADIYEFLIHGNLQCNQQTRRLAVRFFIRNGLLYHSRVVGSPQIYVPGGGSVSVNERSKGTIRANILYSNHDLFCHRGYHKLVYEISNTFWWPSLLGDCLLYCKSCSECQLVKARFSKFKGELSGIESSSFPLKNWVIDFAGPIRGDKYVLICVCCFSSYAILIETTDCSAATTARALFDRIVCAFGMPECVFSDRGTHFDNEIIKNMNERLGIKWRLSSSYNPRSQGTAERLVSHMKQSLQLLNFDLLQLPLIQLYHNVSLIGDSVLSPHEIVFGLRPNTSALIKSDHVTIPNDDLSMLIVETRITWQAFKRFMRDRQSDVYSIKATSVQFSPGDQVFRIYVTSNLAKRTVRTGPYKIISKAGRNTYNLDGIKYPIPEYQLHAAISRPSDLSLEFPVEPTSSQPYRFAPVLSDLKIGDIVLFETFENFDGNVISVDVGEIYGLSELSDNRVSILRYYYQEDGRWVKWNQYSTEDGSISEIPVDRIVRSGIRLRNGRIPREIMHEIFGKNI